MLCNDNVPIWHRFRDITTIAVHVTACDLEKSFIFHKTVEITSHVRFSTHVQQHRSKWVPRSPSGAAEGIQKWGGTEQRGPKRRGGVGF